MNPMYFYLYVAANATTQHAPANEWSYNATVTIVGVAAIAIALLICWAKRNNN